MCPAFATVGIILDTSSANDQWHYYVTPSPVGWAHTQNDPCTWVMNAVSGYNQPYCNNTENGSSYTCGTTTRNRLKSDESMMTLYGNVFCITGPLWGECTSCWWIYIMKNPLMWSSRVIFVIWPYEDIKHSATEMQISNTMTNIHVISLWPSDATWRHRSGSTLTQVMACCLAAPSHYLN